MRLAGRVEAAYLPGVAAEGRLPPMQALGRIYPMFGAVYSEPSARERDLAWLASGELIDIGIGSYGAPHPSVIEAAVRALESGHTRYLELEALPAAVAAAQREVHGAAVDPAEVVVLGGARAGIMLTFLALIERGDRVVIPDPDYPGVSHAAALLDAVVVRPAMRKQLDRSFAPDIDAIADAMPGARILAFTNPGNPTGHVWTEGELRAIADVAREQGVTVVVNEVYDRLQMTESKHVGWTAFNGLDRGMVIGGTAKCYDMTGFRIGWIIAERSLAARLTDLRFLAHQAEAPAADQFAAVAALTPPVRDTHPATAAAALLENARATVDALSGIPGVRCPQPRAGQFAFIEVGGDDQALAERLKEEAGVCVVPGGAWGACGRGHLRIALCNPPGVMAEGLRRLRSGLETLR